VSNQAFSGSKILDIIGRISRNGLPNNRFERDAAKTAAPLKHEC
jgi:hypothetical protein